MTRSAKKKGLKRAAGDDINKVIGDLVSSINNKSVTISIGTVRGEHSISAPVAGVIPTGSIALDKALGVGGVPQGRIVEIYGPESSGKTTLALHIIAQAQEMGLIASFIDAEHALDPDYAQALGVNLKQLLIQQPDSGEQALQTVEMLVRSNQVGVVVIDSVAALVPQAELDGEMGDSLPGLQARLMSQAMRKLTGAVSGSNVCVIFINQIRHKIGVRFGSPETTSGGNALKFYASVRLDIRRIGGVKKGEEVIANRTKVKVIKNKVAPPLKKVEFDIVFGEGIDQAGELVDIGLLMGVLTRKGAWYALDGANIGQGREKTKQYILETPEVYERLKKAAMDG